MESKLNRVEQQCTDTKNEVFTLKNNIDKKLEGFSKQQKSMKTNIENRFNSIQFSLNKTVSFLKANDSIDNMNPEEIYTTFWKGVNGEPLGLNMNRSESGATGVPPTQEGEATTTTRKTTTH